MIEYPRIRHFYNLSDELCSILMDNGFKLEWRMSESSSVSIHSFVIMDEEDGALANLILSSSGIF